MLRILHIADSHIGVDLPARPRKNIPRRGDDIIDSYQRVLRLAFEQDVQLVIHAGDVFDTPQPSSTAMNAAAQPLLDVAVAGIPVFIIPGNHERSALPELLLWSHPNITVVTEPTTKTYRLNGNTVAVSGFPCVRRASAGAFPDTLAATRWTRARADYHILTAHQTFEAAVCGPTDYRFRSGENVIDRDAIPAAFHYVAAGHVHRHQVLTAHNRDETPIVYAGSPDRIAFAERGEPKGAVLIHSNGNGLTPDFLEHDIRPMEVIPLDVTGLGRGQLIDAIMGQLTRLPEQSVALLRLTGTSTHKIMQGLDLKERLHQARPDMMLTVAARDIEYTRHAPQIAGRGRSAFAVLDAPEGLCFDLPAGRANLLPRTPGNYTFLDAHHRLLYIGKAVNLRTRVQSHLRVKKKTESSHRGGTEWTRQIARVEVRVACSDLEALLVEADLIRKHRPPFNRQMRMWSRYCYISLLEQPWPHLALKREPVRDALSFGPYRSRYFATEVLAILAHLFSLPEAPGVETDNDPAESPSLFAGTAPDVGPEDSVVSSSCEDVSDECPFASAGMLSAIEILSGRDDRLICELEKRCAVLKAESDAPPPDDLRFCIRQVEMLREAYARSRRLRHAESLLRRVLVLPGAETSRTLVLFTHQGPLFELIRDDVASAAEVLPRLKSALARQTPSGPLGKSIADGLLTVVQTLKRARHGLRLIPASDFMQFTPSDLQRVALSAWPREDPPPDAMNATSDAGTISC